MNYADDIIEKPPSAWRTYTSNLNLSTCSPHWEWVRQNNTEVWTMLICKGAENDWCMNLDQSTKKYSARIRLLIIVRGKHALIIELRGLIMILMQRKYSIRAEFRSTGPIFS